MIENYLKKRRLCINEIHELRRVNKRFICCQALFDVPIAKKAWCADLPGWSYYACRSYTDKKVCSKHSIREDRLENAILTALQMQITLIDQLAEEIERINRAPAINRENKRLTQSLKQAEKKLAQYNDAIDDLYLDWKSGEISKDDYRRLKSKVTEQIRQLEANISYLKEEISAIENGIGTDDPYLMSFLKYRNIQSLNRGILVELVKAVWVHKNGEITVDFNFADEFQRILDYIECEHSALTPMEQKAAM